MLDGDEELVVNSETVKQAPTSDTLMVFAASLHPFFFAVVSHTVTTASRIETRKLMG